MENTSVFSKIRDMVDKAVLYDEFEMDKLDVSQMVSIDQQRRSTFFYYIYIYIFWVFIIKSSKGMLIQFFLLTLMMYLSALLARLLQSLSLWADHFHQKCYWVLFPILTMFLLFLTYGFEFFFSQYLCGSRDDFFLACPIHLTSQVIEIHLSEEILKGHLDPIEMDSMSLES